MIYYKFITQNDIRRKNKMIEKKYDVLRLIENIRCSKKDVLLLKKELKELTEKIIVMTREKVDNSIKNIGKVVNMPEQKSMKELKKEINTAYAAVREEYKMLQDKLKSNVNTKKSMREDIEIFDDLRKIVPVTPENEAKLKEIWEKLCPNVEERVEELVEEPVGERVEEPVETEE